MRHMQWLFLLNLCGCMVGPNYQKPHLAMPIQFVEIQPEFVSSNNDLFRWWKQFEDPFLDALIEEACQANFDVRIALEKILEARAHYRIERSKLWPEIDLNAAAIRARNSQNIRGSTTVEVEDLSALGGLDPVTIAGVTSSPGAFGSPVRNFFQIGFDAIWELDFFGKFRRSKRAAWEEWLAIQDLAQNVLITIISEVARHYIIVCALQKKIELFQEKIRIDEELLALTMTLFEAGLASELQIAELEAILKEDTAALSPLESSLKTTIYALAVLLGRQPESFDNVFNERRPIPSGIDRVPIGIPSDLLRRRPDVRAAERQLAAATERIGVAVADLFPHISLTGDSFGYASQKFNQLFTSKSRFWSIGPTINWNLIDFGRTRGLIDMAKSEQKQALLNYEKAVIRSLQDVEGALVVYFEEQKRQSAFYLQTKADYRALQLLKDRFESGLSSHQEVLQAYRKWLDSESTLIDSKQALTTDLIALYKALGGDWECSSLP